MKASHAWLHVLWRLAGRPLNSSLSARIFPGDLGLVALRVHGGSMIDSWWGVGHPVLRLGISAEEKEVICPHALNHQFSANGTPRPFLPLPSIPAQTHMCLQEFGDPYICFISVCVCELADCIKYIIVGKNFKNTGV